MCGGGGVYVWLFGVLFGGDVFDLLMCGLVLDIRCLMFLVCFYIMIVVRLSSSRMRLNWLSVVVVSGVLIVVVIFVIDDMCKLKSSLSYIIV